jgi:predicted nucleic acid-binding protein
MGQPLIVDTSIIVTMERRGQAFTEALPAEADVALPAIVVAEYRAGIEREVDPDRAVRRFAWLASILSQAVVLDYSATTAEYHARLLAYTRQQGTPRVPHDLIIAAHAAETGRAIVTLDRKARFADLPGVTVADVG